MYLCIDVGIKNLAMCIMSKDYSIKLWDTFDILGEDKMCQSITKKGKVCNKKCSYRYGSNFSCKTHFPKEQKLTKIGKQKKSLQDITKAFVDKIQKLYDDIPVFKELDEIHIELQPRCNPKMVMISHIIFGKFVSLYNTTCKIKFISSMKKLRVYNGPLIECKSKNKYTQRKWLGIQHCKWFLENKLSEDQKNQWLPLLMSYKKQDDLCDAMLYCMVVVNCNK